jgi:hypothetical protein
MILVTLPDGHRLDVSAAASYTRMSAAHGHPLLVTSAYRSLAEQAYLYAGWIAHLPGFNFALRPGTSQHQLGLAVDFDATEYIWLETHAADYGWRRTNPAERWHYEYFEHLDLHLLDNTTPPAPPAPATTTAPPEDIMATRAELQADLAAALAPILDQLHASRPVFRIAGTAGAWLDLGTTRRYISGAVYGAMVRPVIADLPAADPFWDLPLVGDPGEVVRQTSTAACWLRVDGGRRWVNAADYAAAGHPTITDVPAGDLFWSLPVVGPAPS